MAVKKAELRPGVERALQAMREGKSFAINRLNDALANCALNNYTITGFGGRGYTAQHALHVMNYTTLEELYEDFAGKLEKLGTKKRRNTKADGKRPVLEAIVELLDAILDYKDWYAAVEINKSDAAVEEAFIIREMARRKRKNITELSDEDLAARLKGTQS